MQALVKYARGPHNIALREVPEPECGPGQVKIAIKAAGICGTDIHVYHDTFATTPPVILGHEFCGQVVEVGQEVTRFKVGDRVTAENVCRFCGRCFLCHTGHYPLCPERKAQGLDLDGAFTSYLVADEEFVFKIPDNISFEEGALSEPLACCAHAVLDQTKCRAGDVVLVSGPGAIGLLTMQLAKAEGATIIMAGTDLDAERLAIARALGADGVVNIQQQDIKQVVQELTDGRGVDVVLECSGAAPAVNMGLELVRKRGKYTQVGLFGKPVTIDLEKVCYKEIKLTGSLSHSRDAWIRGLKLVEQGKIQLKPLITHILSISEWEEGFRLFSEKKGLKIILKPVQC
ncbi:D-arabitol-phosphate dehydrogenase [Neomoorella glycerini]|uniref:D-arabitol-phosphate dehydrogenase n=1 Tax=Neomoorella glycerini TaxID=55779 RepID=A0A6I5ZPX0_9FIRM|nr:zinc-binding dehydrogenase [Moorella glycerini]QGP92054.1 D-arabitol-phosphate dehydrogenase [Moorella glycerini]